jgi:hypothetical protein
MTGHITLMAPPSVSACVTTLALVSLIAFTFAPKQTLLQIPDPGLCRRKLCSQRILTLDALRLHLTQEPPQAGFAPIRSGQRTLVQVLEVIALHEQFDVLLPAQRDKFAGKRHRIPYHRTRLQHE